MSELDAFLRAVQRAIDSEADSAAEKMRQNLLAKLARLQGGLTPDLTAGAERVRILGFGI